MDVDSARKADAVIASLISESARINASTARLSVGAYWFRMLLGACAFAAAMGFAKYLG